MRRCLALGPAALVALIAAMPVVAGCTHAAESFIAFGGAKVDAAVIDHDPSALLPSGILVYGDLDAAAMFQSKWGPDVAQMVTNLLPLGAESNFSPARDVTRVLGGAYALSGADFCAVMQGSFDMAAIQRAADTHAISVAGAPLVKTRYAETDMFTAGNVGFVVLTGHTVLTGNETGMRRALDRLRNAKLERSIPAWMAELRATPGAALVAAADMSSQPAVDAVTGKFPFLAGLRTARVIGNFKPPGLNLAGTLTYGDAGAAQAAASALQATQSMSSVLGVFSALGFGAPLPAIDLKQRESDLAFTTAVDDKLVQMLVRMGVGATRVAAMAVTASPR